MEELSTVQVVVAVALCDPNRKVLLQQRPAGKAHGGLWEFPGGKVETGESCESALVREIDEELGIWLDQSDLLPTSFITGTTPGGRPICLLLYVCTTWQGEPFAREAGTAVAWADLQALTEFAMPPLDVPLAKALIRFLEGVAKAESHP